MLAYKQAQASTATPAIATFGNALAGHTVQVFAGKAGKRQVIRLTSKDDASQVADLILSQQLSDEFKGGLISITGMANCEIHQRETVNAKTGAVESWYILQRPATATKSLDGDKLAAKGTSYVTKGISLKGVSAEDFVA